MMLATFIIIAQEAAPAAAKDNSTVLGFFLIGLFIAVVAALAYMIGKQRSVPKETHCPKCNAPKRGDFCPVCGTKF